MYDDCTIRITRLQNGYTVSMTDPAIVEQNKKRNDAKDGCCGVAWQDPDVKYAFTKKQEVLDFISANIDKALPDDEYASSFDKALKEK